MISTINIIQRPIFSTRAPGCRCSVHRHAQRPAKGKKQLSSTCAAGSQSGALANDKTSNPVGMCKNLSLCRFFHCRRVVCACSAGTVGSFSNKPLCKKYRVQGSWFYAQPEKEPRSTPLAGRVVPRIILPTASAKKRSCTFCAKAVQG